MDSTDHFEARKARTKYIHNEIGIGNIVDKFIVDRGHPGGNEIHSVTDTAIIIIQNETTKRLITELIARPEQLRRLYRGIGKEPPKSILKLAYEHNKYRLNEI